jgi:uncharacterized DUF497 family protein
MKLEFDSEKDRINRQKHGLSLAAAAGMDLLAARVILDDRQDYGETRFRAYGWIGGRLHMLAFTMRGDTIRAISLRKANQREVKRHGEET